MAEATSQYTVSSVSEICPSIVETALFPIANGVLTHLQATLRPKGLVHARRGGPHFELNVDCPMHLGDRDVIAVAEHLASQHMGSSMRKTQD